MDGYSVLHVEVLVLHLTAVANFAPSVVESVSIMMWWDLNPVIGVMVVELCRTEENERFSRLKVHEGNDYLYKL